MCLSNRAKAKVSVTVKLPIDVDLENGQGFNEWVRRQMECQHSDEVIIVLTPDGYEAVDFYVFLPVDQYKIGCQTKIWTSADKTQQLEQARGNALAGRGNEQRWQPLLQCEHFVSYVGSDLSTDPQRPWIVGASTMAQHFSRSFLRYGIMGN